MKKGLWWLIGIIVVLVGIGGALYGIQNYGRSYYAQVGNVGHIYLQKKDDGTVMGKSYTYNMTGYDKNGSAKKLSVNSMIGVKFTKGHYVKVLWSPAKGVKSYERVSWSQVPKAAQVKLK